MSKGSSTVAPLVYQNTSGFTISCGRVVWSRAEHGREGRRQGQAEQGGPGRRRRWAHAW